MDKLDTTRLKEVFGNSNRFGEKELRILREDSGWIGHFSSKADWVETRMTVELIDTIRQLDETSTRLITTTNRLTSVILGVTVVGVVLAAISLFKG